MLRALDSRAAADADVVSLMTAVPSLVRAVRYGDVRGTPTQALSAVVDALCVRICAGLPAAAGGLADDAAARLRDAMDGLHGALAVHAQSAQGGSSRAAWLAVAGHAGGTAGRARAGRGAGDADARRRRGAARGRWRRVGSAPPCRPGCRPRRRRTGRRGSWPAGAGSSGSGLLLVHDRDLLGVVDAWVASLRPAEFEEVLPLLRRTFGEFTDAGAGEHRARRASAGRR